MIKSQKFNFPDSLRHTKQMLKNKIVHLKEIYKFDFVGCEKMLHVFLKVDRAISKLITLLISNKKEFHHFFKSRSSAKTRQFTSECEAL